jgi:hypothetical protein
VDRAGNVYVAGWTQGTFSGQRRAGSWDAFLVKYDSAGTQQWLRQLGTSESDSVSGVSVDGGGDIYVVGRTAGTFDGQRNAGGDDAFLVKYDRSGTQQWLRQLGTSRDDRARGVSVASAGNAYVVGATEGTFDGQRRAGGRDAFLVVLPVDAWSRMLQFVRGSQD